MSYCRACTSRLSQGSRPAVQEELVGGDDPDAPAIDRALPSLSLVPYGAARSWGRRGTVAAAPPRATARGGPPAPARPAAFRARQAAGSQGASPSRAPAAGSRPRRGLAVRPDRVERGSTRTRARTLSRSPVPPPRPGAPARAPPGSPARSPATPPAGASRPRRRRGGGGSARRRAAPPPGPASGGRRGGGPAPGPPAGPPPPGRRANTIRPITSATTNDARNSPIESGHDCANPTAGPAPTRPDATTTWREPMALLRQ